MRDADEQRLLRVGLEIVQHVHQHDDVARRQLRRTEVVQLDRRLAPKRYARTPDVLRQKIDAAQREPDRGRWPS